MKKIVMIFSIALVVAASVQAAVTITVVGDGDGYDATEAQAEAWRSTSVSKGTLDLYGNEAFGNAGSWFATPGSPLPNGTDNSPAWATTFTQAASAWVSGASAARADYDNPNVAIGATVTNWTSTGWLGASASVAIGWNDLLSFDITASAPGTFRLGIMANNEGTTKWAPSGFRLSFNGGIAQEVTGLIIDGTLGIVFFDITVTGGTTGTFQIESQGVAGDSRGGTLTGVMFDTIQPKVTITAVGDGIGYDATAAQAAAWRSTSVSKGDLDISQNEAFGNSGSWFATPGLPTPNGTDNSPAWATTFTKAAGYTAPQAPARADYDNPNAAIGPTVVDWTSSGWHSPNSGGADFKDLLSFDITAGAPEKFRLGILAGNEANTTWAPSGLRLSFTDGVAPTVAVSVKELPVSLGMVFWDITVPGSTTGTFLIESQDASKGGSLTGLTFDSHMTGSIFGVY